ncbi:MAG TPA: hypothetical protein VHX88_08960 [Solirubrobacteraceae bacterium]|jgi:hypothetical protein|nr:hypothetical protein [Solirubrobacteraceae bacterium]
MPTSHSQLQILRANEFLQKASESFYFQCTTRTVQESKLFPVNPYIALSYYQAFYRWPEMLRKVDAAMPAEEIGDRARQVGSYVNTITMHLIPQFYLGARQFMIDMGMLRPTDVLDDVMTVLDFGQRVNLAYHRAHRGVYPSDRGYRDQVHTARQTRELEDACIGVTPGDRLHTSFGRFMAAVSAYGFLSHCECRLSFCNHGPYRTTSGHEMLVRDALDLAECDYPWMDGVACEIEHNNLTVPVVMRDTHFNMVDDWGSFEASPAYDAHNLVAVGLFTSDPLSDGYVPLSTGNASDLADELDQQRERFERATAAMWRTMAGWTREQMIDAGLLVYAGVLKDLTHFAGVYDQDEWFTIEDRVQRFRPLMNDEYGGGVIAELVGYLSLSSQQQSEHHMQRYTGARGEMWTPIPYSVLADEEWTSTTGPIQIGSSSLPAKAAKYTTTRGKLTQEEYNQRARDFSSSVHERRHYDDDTYVKHHAAALEPQPAG